jgi:hypothetical protein
MPLTTIDSLATLSRGRRNSGLVRRPNGELDLALLLGLGFGGTRLGHLGHVELDVELFGDAIILVGDVGVGPDVYRENDQHHGQANPEGGLTHLGHRKRRKDRDHTYGKVNRVPLSPPQVEAAGVLVEDLGNDHQPSHEGRQEDDRLPKRDEKEPLAESQLRHIHAAHREIRTKPQRRMTRHPPPTTPTD